MIWFQLGMLGDATAFAKHSLRSWLRLAWLARFVYVLRSDLDAAHHYVGLTSDALRRLGVHNSAGSQYAAALRPWRLLVAIEFAARASAIAKRHFN